MKKIMVTLLALAVFAVNGYSQGAVSSVFGESASGTRSATAIVKPGKEPGIVTDLTWEVDSGVQTASVDIRLGEKRYAVASATSGSGTVLWFTNSGTAVAADEFVIFHDVSVGTYTLHRVQSATATSVTVYETVSVATTTSDFVFSLLDVMRRPARPVTTSGTTGPAAVDIHIPADLPSAFIVDGNTTSCRVNVNGVRSAHK